MDFGYWKNCSVVAVMTVDEVMIVVTVTTVAVVMAVAKAFVAYY